MEVLGLILTYYFKNTANYVFVFCLFYKIVVYCITKCMTELLKKNVVLFEINDFNLVTVDMERYNKRECFLDYTILGRQVVQSLLIMIYKTQSSKNTLSGLSAKSSPDLGMSLPAPWDEMVIKCLPKYGQVYNHEVYLSTTKLILDMCA